MLRGDQIQTVKQAWDEWAVGVNGGPSIRILEKQNRAWYTQSERKFFNRRRMIYNAVIIKAYLLEKGAEALHRDKKVVSERGKEKWVLSELPTETFITASIQWLDAIILERRKNLDWLQKNAVEILPELDGVSYSLLVL
jgi:hypothetical protein